MMEPICERVRVAAMAIADGYKPRLPLDEIESHLAACDGCRREVEQMKAVMEMLDRQKRRAASESLWPRVEQRLDEAAPRKPSQSSWRAFLIMLLLLLGYKVIELAIDQEPGLAFKLVPVVIAVAAFVYLKENPFKIKMELKLEGE